MLTQGGSNFQPATIVLTKPEARSIIPLESLARRRRRNGTFRKGVSSIVLHGRGLAHPPAIWVPDCPLATEATPLP